MINGKTIYAVDFDGVLCENEYPEIGEPKQDVIDYILNEQRKGAITILWTSRVKNELQDAVEWCKDHGIIFDYVNQNAFEVIDEFGGDSRKIYADYYIDDHNLPIEECKEKSCMEEWAEKEIEIALLNKFCGEDEDFDYISFCYQSALKAYKSLCNDEHSMRSFCITKNILESLMNDTPLTPIEGNEEDWNPVSDKLQDTVEWCKDHGIIFDYEKFDYKCYQCKRKDSLFKEVYKDGTVKYTDISRFHCYDENNNSEAYGSGIVNDVLDELYPIEMPYYPSNKPYRVICEEWLTDEKNDDFDTLGIISVVKPDGTTDDIYRYFKYAKGSLEVEEIQESEYRDRIRMHHEREDKKMEVFKNDNV